MASSSSKRLKLSIDPDSFQEESEDNFEGAGHVLCGTINQLSSLDGSVQVSDKYSLDSLPMEIIQEICVLLSLRDKMSLRLVNRQLYMICSDPYLWRNVVIDDAYHKTDAPFIKSALKTCQPHVQSFSLRGQLPFSQYQPVIFKCKNIHLLNFYGLKINFVALGNILSPTTTAALPHLQCLTLPIYSNCCELHVFRVKFSYLSHLKKLIIITNWTSTNQLLFSLFKSWVENKCLPRLFVVVGDFHVDACADFSKCDPVIQSAYFVCYSRYRRPLNFDFYDVPQVQCGPDDSDTLAVTANRELIVKVRDYVSLTAQSNDDFSRKYAVIEGSGIAPGLPVYNSQLGKKVSILHFDFVSISLVSFSSIVKGTPNVLEVSLQGSTVSDGLNAYMVPLSEHCLKLRGLDVSDFCYSDNIHANETRIDKEHFWCILSKMKCLELLSINCFMLLHTIDSPSVLEQGDEEELHLSDSDNNMINYIKSMTRLKGLNVVQGYIDGMCYECYGLHVPTVDPPFNLKTKHYRLIHHFMFPVVSNLRFLTYLSVEFPFFVLDSGLTNGLEEVLRHCQQLSVLIVGEGVKLTLPVDPSLYSNLTHFWLNCRYTLITSEFVTALAINSRNRLKHFVVYLPTDGESISSSVLVELVESCSFITCHLLNFKKEKYEDAYKYVSSLARRKFQYFSFGELSLSQIEREFTDFGLLHSWDWIWTQDRDWTLDWD